MATKRLVVSVYTLPPGSKPIVRVECPERSIESARLFKLCCDTIGLYVESRKFFGLFRGMLHPVKKYGTGERIAIPVKTHPITIQRWSFDLTLEKRYIKTDATALRLLAIQYKTDLELSRKHPLEDERAQLKEFDDVDFPLYKQYLDFARTLHDYEWVTVQGVEVVNKVKLINNTLQKESKVDITCTPSKMVITAPSFDLAIPWRKIRRFVEIKETRTISFEILIESKTFTWVEFKSIQGVYLLQLVAEYIEAISKRIQPATFRQPKWVTDEEQCTTKKTITFKMIKEELFGTPKKKTVDEEGMFYDDFDAIDVPSSEEDEEDTNGRSQTSIRSSLRGSSLFSSRTPRSMSFCSSHSSKKYLGVMEDDEEPGPSENNESRLTLKSKASNASSLSLPTEKQFELLDINID